MLQLEEYGFCKKGEGGHYVSSGIIELGGKRPNNTSGGHLCEGYTHGMSMVIENVRQLRRTVDDACPQAAEGVHTYDYAPGRCRQVRDAEITMNLGWAMPATGSALILRRYVTPMPNGSADVEDWLDFFAVEGLVLAGPAPGARIVLAPGPQHRCSPPVAGRAGARAGRSMPAAASRVKPGGRMAAATLV